MDEPLVFYLHGSKVLAEKLHLLYVQSVDNFRIVLILVLMTVCLVFQVVNSQVYTELGWLSQVKPQIKMNDDQFFWHNSLV